RRTILSSTTFIITIALSNDDKLFIKHRWKNVDFLVQMVKNMIHQYFILELNENKNQSKLILDDAFFEQFNSLCSIHIINVKIERLTWNNRYSHYLNDLCFIRLINNNLH
ncbi:unnamed protein product, partial [Didymodactylos carnosus]